MSTCVFCAILAGQSPGSIFYADATVVGLLDINPVTEGHALIIPRRHTADLAALDEATGQWMWTKKGSIITHSASVESEG